MPVRAVLEGLNADVSPRVKFFRDLLLKPGVFSDLYLPMRPRPAPHPRRELGWPGPTNLLARLASPRDPCRSGTQGQGVEAALDSTDPTHLASKESTDS